MTYSDFCKAFYHGRSKSSLEHYTSKNAIAGFLMRIAVGRESWDRVEATDPDNRKKIAWFEDASKPDKELWKDARDNIKMDEYARELEAEFSSVDEDLLIKTARSFGVLESELNKTLLAEALAEQFRVLANGDGVSRNLVPETYSALLLKQNVKNMATDSLSGDVSEQQPGENSKDSDESGHDQTGTSDVSSVPEPFLTLTKRGFYKLILFGMIMLIVSPIFAISIAEHIPVDTSEEVKHVGDDYANGVLTAIYTNEQKLSAADKLYNWSQLINDLDSRNQYYIYSAILKESVLDRQFIGEQEIRIAQQGLNICETVLESVQEGTFYYYMARILCCLFYEVLGDAADETAWSQDINIIEEYLGSFSLDVKKNEDALLSNYGYRALMGYYERMLQIDYHLGTEEIYKKYIDYYNIRCNNRFRVAISYGSDTPAFDLKAFATYSEIVFRLVKLDPSYDYVTYLSGIIDQCEATRPSKKYMDMNSYESLKLTSIMADAYYHWSLIAEKEVNEYDLDQVQNLKLQAESLFSSLLKYETVNHWEDLDIIVKGILKSTEYDCFSFSESEDVKRVGDFVLDLPEWGFAPSSEAISELKTAICVSCYNIHKNKFISDKLIDLGKRAAEYLVPIDTYDLVVTEEDISWIREYLETCERETPVPDKVAEDPYSDEG